MILPGNFPNVLILFFFLNAQPVTIAQTSQGGHFGYKGPTRKSCNSDHHGKFACFQLYDNFRDEQSFGEKRSLLRSKDATSICQAERCDDNDQPSTTCPRSKMIARTDRAFEHSNKWHWVYADQKGWKKYRGSTEENECSTPLRDLDSMKRPGESPINVKPDEAVEDASMRIELILSSFRSERTDLTILNNGYGVQVIVCGSNGNDCGALAKFGQLPRALRNLAEINTDDEYYLSRIEFHWGSDDSKGSEHKVCGKPRSAEMHWVFTNKQRCHDIDTPDGHCGTNSEDRGLETVILATLIDAKQELPHRRLGTIETGGNSALAHIFKDATKHARYHGESHASVDVTLYDLLPEDYDTKFYSYAGSFTTPPCSMTVTWIVFENYLTIDEKDLNYLRNIYVGVHSHAYTALLFPFFAIMIGVGTQYILSRYEKCTKMPYTILLLILGISLDLVCTQLSFVHGYNSLQQSLDMWASIDGHLLLYAFLPALLFGDAMSFDVHLFDGTKLQCYLLACPGVALGTALTAACGHYIIQWDWSLSLVFGSIMAATDPVAVVSLLKAVGANPKLTMQITGESLLNDGTAIVFFNIFIGFYGIGTEKSAFEMLMYFLLMPIGGYICGRCLGQAALYCLTKLNRKHDHEDVTMQVATTVCCAYLSFFLAESELGVSGVLCTVYAALELARYAMPLVCKHESMEDCWHLIEFFGNTIIFILAGVITHRATFHALTMESVGKVILMYFCLLVIRGFMILMFYPFLKELGYGTNPKDACFMAWAGLRGAVGLALAVYVADQAPIQEEGEELIFYVSFLAFGTLMVNGWSAEYVLKWAKMVGIRGSEEDMLEKVKLRVKQNAEEVYHRSCVEMRHDAGEVLAPLKHLGEHLRHILEEKEKGIESQTHAALDSMEDQLGSEKVHHHNRQHTISKFYEIESLEKLRDELLAKAARPLREDLLAKHREAYYDIVLAHYWEMIEGGHLPPKSAAVRFLLHSIEVSRDDCHVILHDWDYLDLMIKKDIGIMEKFVYPVLNKILPEWVTCDTVHQISDVYHRMETQFYVLHGFREATKHAQHNLAEYFGASEFLDKEPESPEEIQVLLESAYNYQHSEENLDSMHGDLVHRTKSKIIVLNLLDEQHNFVCKLMKEGILTPSAAEVIFKDLENDKHDLERFNRARDKMHARKSIMGVDGRARRMNSDTIKRLTSGEGSMLNMGNKFSVPSLWSGRRKKNQPLKHDAWKRLREKQHLITAKHRKSMALTVQKAIAAKIESPASAKISPEISKEREFPQD